MGAIRIMIVEDEALIAFHLRTKLLQAGFEVGEPVGSGAEAVERARSDDPDAIVMDVSLLGEMDGIEAAGRIAEFSSARIIFATGHADPQLRKRAMALNPAAFLNKPVSVSSIEAVIREFAR